MADQNLTKPRLDPNQTYPVVEYLSKLMHLAELLRDNIPIQETITEQIEWANGLPPNASICFKEDEHGIFHPHGIVEAILQKESE